MGNCTFRDGGLRNDVIGAAKREGSLDLPVISSIDGKVDGYALNHHLEALCPALVQLSTNVKLIVSQNAASLTL